MCCARHRMVAGRFLYYYNMFLAKVALIGESLGLPPGLAAGPMLVAACEAMGIQPGQRARRCRSSPINSYHRRPRDAVADCRASTEGREVGIEPADKVKKLGRSAL